MFSMGYVGPKNRKCPFCGGEMYTDHKPAGHISAMGSVWWAGCTECGATTGDCDSEREAEGKWNARRI